MAFWTDSDEHAYYFWSEQDDVAAPDDRDIKTVIVQRLHEDPYTATAHIKVDVREQVVVLGGRVDSGLAKRLAGDVAWDTPGVLDVSNDLEVPFGGVGDDLPNE